MLTNPAIRDRGRDPDALWADLTRRVGIAKTPNARRDALRRFKPPEVLRIGARDLLGYAECAGNGAGDQRFRRCLRSHGPATKRREERQQRDAPFAVFALGKLGGRELNYASDIDLIFVHGDSTCLTAEAVRLGRDRAGHALARGDRCRVCLPG